MPRKIISDRTIIEDPYRHVSTLEEAQANADQNIIIEVALLDQLNLDQHSGQIGVSIAPDMAIDDLASTCAKVDLIALSFPSFMDGRAYSQARQLRQRHQFKGDIRAQGDILKDQLAYMSSCGFTSFEVREDKDIQTALLGLNDYQHNYLGELASPSPWFRR